MILHFNAPPRQTHTHTHYTHAHTHRIRVGETHHTSCHTDRVWCQRGAPTHAPYEAVPHIHTAYNIHINCTQNPSSTTRRPNERTATQQGQSPGGLCTARSQCPVQLTPTSPWIACIIQQAEAGGQKSWAETAGRRGTHTRNQHRATVNQKALLPVWLHFITVSCP